jgi:hypothetical protein
VNQPHTHSRQKKSANGKAVRGGGSIGYCKRGKDGFSRTGFNRQRLSRLPHPGCVRRRKISWYLLPTGFAVRILTYSAFGFIMKVNEKAGQPCKSPFAQKRRRHWRSAPLNENNDL